MFKKRPSKEFSEKLQGFKLISIPEKGCTDIYVSNNISIPNVIFSIANIDEIFIYNYWVNLEIAKYIHENSKASEFFLANNYKLASRSKFSFFDNKKITLMDNHSKVALIKSGKNYIVCTGSGNISNQNKCEALTVSNDLEVYEKIKNTYTEIIKTKDGRRKRKFKT